MVFSSSLAIGHPYPYPVAIQTALEWIAGHDIANMEPGTYELQGRDIYVNIQDLITKPIEECLPERHTNYLDIQYVVSGVERMGYAPYTGRETVQWDMQDKDITIYRDLENENFVDVAPGGYCIFFSDSIHRPCCAAGSPGSVRKAVAKIKQSLLVQHSEEE